MSDEKFTCRCGAEEGEVHAQFMCDFERCPFCGHQLSTCGCVYTMLGIRDKAVYGPETDYLPYDTYTKGLSDEQIKTWQKVCEARGRVPNILWPNICGRCGELWPEMFRVPDEEWNQYVEIEQRRKMLCQRCYDEIKELIDSAKKKQLDMAQNTCYSSNKQ